MSDPYEEWQEKTADYSDAYKELAIAANNFFEFDTFKRYKRLMKATEAALEELQLGKLGWGSGWRLYEEYKEVRDKTWKT